MGKGVHVVQGTKAHAKWRYNSTHYQPQLLNRGEWLTSCRGITTATHPSFTLGWCVATLRK